MVEIKVHTCGWIIEQKPSRLRQRVTLCLCIHKNSSNTQGCLKQTFHDIVRQSNLLAQFLTRHSIIRVAQQFQYTELHHQP